MNPTVTTGASVQCLLGKAATRFFRIYYQVGSNIERDEGALEILLDDGVVLLDGAADGERLRVRDEPWRDPFAAALTEENKEYVAEHGKWVRVEVSDDQPYRDLVGRRIEDVLQVENQFGSIAGAAIVSTGRILFFWIDSDEAKVGTELPASYRIVNRGLSSA